MSSTRVRSFFLLLTLAFIFGSIFFLENQNPNPSPSGTVEFVNPSGFINAEPFQLSDVIGKKVILVDFWTYTCINCQRTQPYLNDWWTKYKDSGLLIVGVHTPEFEFEKEENNVKSAVASLGIEYPVVMDNDYGTWGNFGNRYWPHKYLIDLNGKLVYDHIGEGNYDETEAKIQELTGMLNTSMSTPSGLIDIDFDQVQSPETYFGSNRASNLSFVSMQATGIEPNWAYLIGDWTQKEEYSTNTSVDASLEFEYNAKNVYAVASADTPVEVEVWLDGTLVNTITVDANTLYPLVQGESYGKHRLLLKPKGAGLQLFTFTFG